MPWNAVAFVHACESRVKTYLEFFKLLRRQRSNDAWMAQFIAWREEVDEEHLLDTFDLALGYFSGAGMDHESALDLCDSLSREEARKNQHQHN
jgi:hypothetical protein